MNFKKGDLIFLPLGGAGEIGMNCYLYHYNDSWIMVDLGVMFNDNQNLGYDIIMPDLKFIIERKKKIIWNYNYTRSRRSYWCTAIYVS